MIKKIKDGWWKTESLYFEDRGFESGRKTRTFKIMNKNKFIMGTIKWAVLFACYSFYPDKNRPLLPKHLIEIAEFAQERTKFRPGRLAEERAKKEERKKRYLKNRKKDLTNTETCDRVINESEVPIPEKSVVEGVLTETLLNLGE